MPHERPAPEIFHVPRWRRRLRELRRLVLLYGAWATLRYLLWEGWRRLTRKATVGAGLAPPAPPLDFDARLGVTTEGIHETSELDTIAEGWIHSFGYEATPLDDLTPLLDGLDLDMAATTFLDLGSGKGRMLILALPLGFKRIVGVEISPSLTEQASRNLTALSPDHPATTPVELICADAAHTPIPGGPLLIYLFNPFNAVAMQQVIDRIKASFKAQPRRMVVLYHTPVFSHLWEQLDFLELRHENNDDPRNPYAVFDTRPEALTP